VILVDTSVWIDHLRHGDSSLINMLNGGLVIAHPFVIGELALGNLKQRDVILDALNNLSSAKIATDNEVLSFICQNQLYGLGIGYIDVHLLASVRLMPGVRLWTRDKRLRAAASQLGLLADLDH
jgi:predicted nucleic acid-binding protein